RATAYLSLLGKEGLREVAELCTRKAHYAAEQLAKVKNFELAFPDRPFFKEFTVRVRGGGSRKLALAHGTGIEKRPAWHRYPASGLPTGSVCLLVAVTERRTCEEIDRLVAALQPPGWQRFPTSLPST